MRAGELETVVELWHETCVATYTFIEFERHRSLAERRRFFSERIAPSCDLWVVVQNEEIAAYMAIRDSYIDRLYVHPSAQRRGAGSALLNQAKQLSDRRLELHTHQMNTGACTFYEKHGFQPMRYGLSPPPESEPDVEYHWRPG